MTVATIGSDFENGAIVSGALDATRSELGAPVPPVFAMADESQIERIRKELGEVAFAEARGRGRRLGVEGILDAMAEASIDRS